MRQRTYQYIFVLYYPRQAAFEIVRWCGLILPGQSMVESRAKGYHINLMS